MKIQFLGAANEVTGSKHLIETDKGVRILLDCGMYQGKGMETDAANRDLGFDAKTIDYVILSHAHIDHCGLLPYLYKEGFRGDIISTPATRDLCAIMLQDTAFIQAQDVRWYNKKMDRLHKPKIQPLYDHNHVEQCMHHFLTVSYNRRFRLTDDIFLTFTNSGHMLGSAICSLDIWEDYPTNHTTATSESNNTANTPDSTHPNNATEPTQTNKVSKNTSSHYKQDKINGEWKKIAYTGDIGRRYSHILSAPQLFPQCDYLICESTYGDRLHDDTLVTEEELLGIVEDTCVYKKGKLIIPSFSVGRTQEIVYVLNQLYNDGRLPRIPVYVDSPLSVNATHIFRLYLSDLNEDVQDILRFDEDPFGFNTLRYITDVNQSKALNSSTTPCIIISSSGMLEAGRVKHHVANHISDPSTTILIVGYCTPTSLGARIQDPTREWISIFGYDRRIKAQVSKIDGFSGHGDYQEMISYFSRALNKEAVRRIFIVHGEKKAQEAYKDHLYEAGFRGIDIPSKGETVYL